MAIEPHIYSFLHRQSILKSKQCGCFYCLELFAPHQIKVWCDSNEVGTGQTALCPCCGIDSVLGDYDVGLSLELLTSMHQIWF